MIILSSSLIFCTVLLCAFATDWYDSSVNSYLLQSVVGEVPAGNYIYYSLDFQGPLSLYLISKSGDADLYVSTSVEKPTYEPDTYDLQSSSCGVDVVHIPETFKRPVHISVYGHSAAETSLYILDVIYREEPFDSEINLEYYGRNTSSRSSMYQQFFNGENYSRGRDHILFFFNFVEPFLSVLEI